MKDIRSMARQLILTIACLCMTAGIVCSAVTAAAAVQEVKVPVLMYHHIMNGYDPKKASAILSPVEFREHLKTLKANNFHFITLQQYYEHVMSGRTLPAKPIIITFDDGYASNYEIAFPMLKEFNIPATIFVVTDTVGETPEGGKVNYAHFTWEQAKEMQDSGLVDIQSHTATHCKLARVSYDQMQRELRMSKYAIEKNLGKTCDILAYPYGSYNDQTIQAAREAGYKMQILVGDAYKDFENEVNVRSEGTEHLKRLTVRGGMSGTDLIEMIEDAMAKPK